MEKENLYNGVTITNSWTLVGFAKKNGLPTMKEYTNKSTNESFATLVFPDAPEGRIYCHFGNSTQGMSIKDIEREKDNLHVGLNSNGNYTLYKETQGEIITLW